MMHGALEGHLKCCSIKILGRKVSFVTQRCNNLFKKMIFKRIFFTCVRQIKGNSESATGIQNLTIFISKIHRNYQRNMHSIIFFAIYFGYFFANWWMEHWKTVWNTTTLIFKNGNQGHLMYLYEDEWKFY